jgi:adenine-specific DNA-methyltransferase
VIEHADNREYLSRMADGEAHLIITSPPYNIGKEYENKCPMHEYKAAQSEVIRECVRVLAPGGSICWQVGNHVSRGEVWPLDILLFDIFQGLGMVMRGRVVWHFEHGLHCTKRFSGRHETIMWFTRPGAYCFNVDPVRVPSKYPNKRHFKGPRKGELSGNPLGKNPGDVWAIPNVKHNHVEKTGHPCQFPVELAERLVLSMSCRGDTVMDPYAGSGSTAVAAEMHGRRGVGCDVVQEYVAIANGRLDAASRGELKTRPMGPAVFAPPLAAQLPNRGA